MTLLWRSGVQAAPGMGDMHRCVRVPAVEIGGYLAESSVNLARRLILTVVQRPRALRWARGLHCKTRHVVQGGRLPVGSHGCDATSLPKGSIGPKEAIGGARG